MKYSFHPAAEKELNDAVDYYNECRAGLGVEFLVEIHQTIQNILSFPAGWSSISENTRRCLTSRFPYGVIYQAAAEEIFIIAVTQLNREPGYWQDRKI